RVRRLHHHHRNVDRRELVDRQLPVAEDAEDHQAQHDHGGEDRPADRDAAQASTGGHLRRQATHRCTVVSFGHRYYSFGSPAAPDEVSGAVVVSRFAGSLAAALSDAASGVFRLAPAGWSDATITA